jgi:hypothetical protein
MGVNHHFLRTFRKSQNSAIIDNLLILNLLKKKEASRLTSYQADKLTAHFLVKTPKQSTNFIS